MEGEGERLVREEKERGREGERDMESDVTKRSLSLSLKEREGERDMESDVTKGKRY